MPLLTPVIRLIATSPTTEPQRTDNLMTSSVRFVSLLLALANCAAAQTAQPEQPPQRIEPGGADQRIFVCTVDDVNYDRSAWNMGQGHLNLWTRFMKGGKFEALSKDRVRVQSASVESAAREVHEFYRRYAAAAFLRGPLYDKGTRPQAAVVMGCEAEAGREVAVSAKALDKSAYRPVLDVWDHFYTGLKYLPKLPPAEQLVLMSDAKGLPTDAFDRKAEVDKRHAAIRQRLEATPRAPIAIQSTPTVQPFDFNSQTFAWPKVDEDVGSYKYTVKQEGRPFMPVAYDLVTSSALRTYRPKSMEEAKAIERARAASKLKMVTYANLSGAELRDQKIIIKGVVAAVEWLDEGDRVLARLEAK